MKLSIGGILAGLASIFVPAGSATSSIEEEVLQDIAAGSAGYVEYESGSAAVVATFTQNGVKGYVLAVKEGGTAAKALGL